MGSRARADDEQHVAIDRVLSYVYLSALVWSSLVKPNKLRAVKTRQHQGVVRGEYPRRIGEEDFISDVTLPCHAHVQRALPVVYISAILFINCQQFCWIIF